MYDEVLNLKNAIVSAGKVYYEGEIANGLLLVYSEQCGHCIDFEETYTKFAKLHPEVNCYAIEDTVEHVIALVEKALEGGLQFVPCKMIIENGTPIEI